MKLNKTITFNNVNITKFIICAKKSKYNAVDIYTITDLFCNTGFLSNITLKVKHSMFIEVLDR